MSKEVNSAAADAVIQEALATASTAQNAYASAPTPGVAQQSPLNPSEYAAAQQQLNGAIDQMTTGIYDPNRVTPEGYVGDKTMYVSPGLDPQFRKGLRVFEEEKSDLEKALESDENLKREAEHLPGLMNLIGSLMKRNKQLEDEVNYVRDPVIAKRLQQSRIVVDVMNNEPTAILTKRKFTKKYGGKTYAYIGPGVYDEVPFEFAKRLKANNDVELPNG